MMLLQLLGLLIEIDSGLGYGLVIGLVFYPITIK